MDRREQAKQQQKQQMQRLSQSDNDTPQQPLFGVPVKVSQVSEAIPLYFSVPSTRNSKFVNSQV